MLSVESISCSYGKVEALRDVSLSVQRGAVVTILGANGAGKTTTLKAIARLLKLTSGRIVFDGHDIGRTPPERVVRMGIGMVPEGRLVFPGLTVGENLRMGAYVRRDKTGVARDLERMYSFFPVLKERSNQIASTLSGGEQQMLATARGLMSRPKILLLDEPSLGLAPVITEEIFEFLAELRKEDITILLVEQNAHMALQVADYAYVLETGSIVLQGKADELLKDTKVQESYLGITTES
jgi:branched-chain amino acid transport system ATP-binding protein